MQSANEPKPTRIQLTRWQIYEQRPLNELETETILVYLESGTWSEVIAKADKLANQGRHIHIFSEPKPHNAWNSPEQIIGNIAKIMTKEQP